MFGYVNINEPELKLRELRTYRAYYCGVCRSLGRFSPAARLALNYETTFLALLLTGLYEEDDAAETKAFRCALHPFRKDSYVSNPYVDYAADMTVLLAYWQCRDHWQDDRKAAAGAEMLLLKKQAKKLAAKYPRQAAAVEAAIRSLAAAEAAGEKDLDKVAGFTGQMLAEIFVCREDEWADTLRYAGFFLGKFVYLMDAYDDLERDRKKHAYNPLLLQEADGSMDDFCEELFTAMLGECAMAFERLPVLLHGGLLRNIIYSGVWSRFELRKAQRQKENNDGSL